MRSGAASFSIELDLFGAALGWLTKARKELGPACAVQVAKNTAFVLLHIDAAYEEKLQLVVLQAWRAVCAGPPGPLESDQAMP